jgi:signal transduction histidine kinase
VPDLLTLAIEVCFLAVFAATLIAYLRRPRPLERDVAAVFGALAFALASPLFAAAVPGVQPLVTVVIAVALLLVPVLTLRLAGHFRRLPRWLLPLASICFVASLLAVMAAEAIPAVTVLALGVLIVYLAGFELLSAAFLFAEARRRVGAARNRLATAAIATFLFGFTIILLTAGASLGGAARLAALLAALGYLAAFAPPRPLRRMAYQAAAYDFLVSLATLAAGTDAGLAWRELATTARRVTGASATLIAIRPDGASAATVRAVSGELDPSLVGTDPTADALEPLVGPRVVDAPQGPWRSVAAGLEHRGLLRIPIRMDIGHGELACFLGQDPLFVEDDAELLVLLGAQTAVAVERSQLLTALRDTNAQLEQASAAKSEFLAAMSHELRTPLNAVIGYSELLVEGAAGAADGSAGDAALADGADGTTREFAIHIRDAGLHLLDLVNDVLDLSRVEAGRLELRAEPTDLMAIAHQTADSMRPLAERKQINVRFEGEVEAPLVADPGRLRQIVYNLLSNALKFTPEGGSVTLIGQASDEGVGLAVRDTGPGVPDEDRTRIFEAFAQGTLGERQAEGTGLGLALTRRLAELHGGRLELESSASTGSTFAVVLPRDPLGQADAASSLSGRPAPGQPAKPIRAPAAPAATLATATTPVHAVTAAPPAAGATPVPAPATSPTVGPTVLVIEDDPAAARLLELYLADAGYSVRIAPTGEEGLVAARSTPPAAILLDLLLPGVDGWHVAQRLRDGEGGADVVVIAVTAVGQREEHARALAAGCDAVLTKPASPRVVLRTLGDWIGYPMRTAP